MLSGDTFSQQGPVINSSTMSHLKGLWAAGETVADLTVWSWWELVSSPHGLFRYNWVTHLSAHRWPVCSLSTNSIPQWNHMCNRLIQPQLWGVLSFWSAVRLTPAFVCFRLYPCTRVWEGKQMYMFLIRHMRTQLVIWVENERCCFTNVILWQVDNKIDRLTRN